MTDEYEPATINLVFPDKPQAFNAVCKLLVMILESDELSDALACGPIKIERDDKSSGIAGRSFSCEGSAMSVLAMVAALSGGN